MIDPVVAVAESDNEATAPETVRVEAKELLVVTDRLIFKALPEIAGVVTAVE